MRKTGASAAAPPPPRRRKSLPRQMRTCAQALHPDQRPKCLLLSPLAIPWTSACSGAAHGGRKKKAIAVVQSHTLCGTARNLITANPGVLRRASETSVPLTYRPVLLSPILLGLTVDEKINPSEINSPQPPLKARPSDRIRLSAAATQVIPVEVVYNQRSALMVLLTSRTIHDQSFPI